MTLLQICNQYKIDSKQALELKKEFCQINQIPKNNKLTTSQKQFLSKILLPNKVVLLAGEQQPMTQFVNQLINIYTKASQNVIILQSRQYPLNQLSEQINSIQLNMVFLKSFIKLDELIDKKQIIINTIVKKNIGLLILFTSTYYFQENSKNMNQLINELKEKCNIPIILCSECKQISQLEIGQIQEKQQINKVQLDQFQQDEITYQNQQQVKNINWIIKDQKYQRILYENRIQCCDVKVYVGIANNKLQIINLYNQDLSYCQFQW